MLIYTANIAVIVCGFAAALLKGAPPVRLMFLVGAGLASLAVVVGKFFCRSIPQSTGLRGLATAVCCFVALGWIATAIARLTRELHDPHPLSSLAHGLGALAALIGWICFMVLLSRIAQQIGDTALAYRAMTLLWTALGLAVILVCGGIVMPTFPRSSSAHRIALPGALLALVGALIWCGLYLQLLKRLADRLEQAVKTAAKAS